MRFFSMVQERVVNPDLNQNIPCVFICDEYQDIISVSSTGLSDLSFWDKSRSAKCIGIISSQSISSFRAACHDRDLADTVLQNFRQKICFRTEEYYKENVITSQLMRELPKEYAVAFLNIEGRSYDDVLKFFAYFELLKDDKKGG